MSELITLDKNSPQFTSYLLGTFAADKRALPLQSLNVNSLHETVTFRVVPTAQIQKPSAWIYLSQTFKLKNFILVLFPLLLIVLKNLSHNTLMDPVSAVISTLGILCAFIGLNLRNDYQDHIKGIDRVLSDRGSRAIQNGWVTAAQIKKYARFFLLIAAACAIPVIVATPSVFFVVIVSALISLWAYQMGGEISLFLLMGPLLTIGYQLAMGMYFDFESLAIGFIWGWMVLYLTHLKNLVSIIPSSQAHFKNTVNRMGFDRARRFIAFWWLSLVLFLSCYFFVFVDSVSLLSLFLPILLFSYIFIKRLKNLSSPAGSAMLQLWSLGRRLFQIVLSLWLLQSFFNFYHLI